MVTLLYGFRVPDKTRVSFSAFYPIFHCRADPNIADNFGWSALHHACRQGYSVIADELIQNGGNVNLHTMAGGTPLMKSIESNNLDCVICCVLNGANLKAKTVCGLSIKEYSRAFGNFRIYKAIARFLKSYKGARNLTKDLSAVDPDTKFAFGDRSIIYGYGTDVRGTFRRERFLTRKSVLHSMLNKELPVRVIKPKALKVSGAPIGGKLI